MRKLVFITFTLLLATCDSIKFQEQVLYEKYEFPASREDDEQVFFSEGTGTMWNSLFNCGNFEISNQVAYSGKSSIKLDWNKAKCEWIGFGNSFNNWQPTDLSESRFRKALSFYVRTQEKTARAIPIVANLEDFSGGGSYYYIDAGKYLYGLEMDTTWKQIIVPLWHFPIDEENEVDISSIKQMKFQLEGGGSFFLDEITIIDYSQEKYDKMRADVELMRPKGNANQIVYREGSFEEDVWGSENNECQTLVEEISKNETKQIHWIYNSKECSWAKWGINWNGWYAMNLRGIDENSSFQIKIKATKNSAFKVFIHDFRGHKAEIFTSKTQTITSNDWTIINVPMKNLNLKDKNFAMDQIREVYFEGTGEGEVFINEIKITDK